MHCWYDVHVHQLILIRSPRVWSSNYIQIQCWFSVSLSLNVYMIFSDAIVLNITLYAYLKKLYKCVYTVHSHSSFFPVTNVSSPLLVPKDLLPREAWYIQTSLGQDVNEAIIGTSQGWKVAVISAYKKMLSKLPSQIKITSSELVYIVTGNIPLKMFLCYLGRWMYELNFNGTQRLFTVVALIP